MEPPGMRVVSPPNEDGTANPNHLIIWLDKHIGKAGECVLLNRAFFMKTDPTTGYAVSLHEEDVKNSIRLGEAISLQLDGVQLTLRAFDDPTTCYEAISNNLDKRIYFITSGSQGEFIVPRLVANFPKTFVEAQPIYIFCAKMNMRHTVGAGDPVHEWAFDYLDNVLMFNHQDDLLARMISDIAKYFSIKAARLETTAELIDARRHYYWSKRVWQRYETVERKKLMTYEIDKIDQRLCEIEQQFDEKNKSENDCMGEPCT